MWKSDCRCGPLFEVGNGVGIGGGVEWYIGVGE